VVLDDSVMRRSDALRAIMGFAKAIVADGDVSEGEAKGFQAWIDAHEDVRGLPAVDEIVGILTNFFADGKLSESEKAQLIKVLEDFGG
jgi:hypothetical protein